MGAHQAEGCVLSCEDGFPKENIDAYIKWDDESTQLSWGLRIQWVSCRNWM